MAASDVAAEEPRNDGNDVERPELAVSGHLRCPFFVCFYFLGNFEVCNSGGGTRQDEECNSIERTACAQAASRTSERKLEMCPKHVSDSEDSNLLAHFTDPSLKGLFYLLT